MENKRLEGLIDIAILREEESYDFYRALFEKVKDREAKETLDFLAGEERKHKQFLTNYKEGKLGAGALALSDFVDYRIAEHLQAPPMDMAMENKDVYLVAAHRELLSYKFYRALADLHPQGEVKEVLMRMANQEMKHKEKVEYLFSNAAFPQTDGG